MNETIRDDQNRAGRANRRVALICLSMVFGMVGMAYAAVPLYDLFCRVTGFGGTTQVAVNADGIAIIDRQVTVRFDANIEKGFGWRFEPVEREVTLRMGETAEFAYRAVNTSDVPLTGSATFNVTPQSAGIYFNKIQCFCFTETTLQPGEEMIMPVVFFVDPEMAEPEETRGINTITLSYTFFEQEPSTRPVAELEREGSPDSEGRL